LKKGEGWGLFLKGVREFGGEWNFVIPKKFKLLFWKYIYI